MLTDYDLIKREVKLLQKKDRMFKPQWESCYTTQFTDLLKADQKFYKNYVNFEVNIKYLFIKLIGGHSES